MLLFQSAAESPGLTKGTLKDPEMPELNEPALDHEGSLISPLYSMA
jgi:hypothetical protein